jgi:hypothetical protein
MCLPVYLIPQGVLEVLGILVEEQWGVGEDVCFFESRVAMGQRAPYRKGLRRIECR